MKKTLLVSLALLCLSLWPVAGCDDGGDGDGDADGDVDGDADGDSDGDGDGDRPPPPAPDEDDPRYTVVGGRMWLMVGDGLTAADDVWELRIEGPDETTELEIWIGEEGPETATATATGLFELELDVSDLAPGEYEVIMAEPGAAEAIAARSFNRSHAYYIVISGDWDDPDISEIHTDNMDELRELHPGVRYTQYLGPVTFTDPEMTDERIGQIVAWLVERRDTYDDEVGLHIHPFCSFVLQAGVAECVTTPSLTSRVDEAGTITEEIEDSTGYSIPFTEYSEADQALMLEAAADLFEANGLGRPTSFRAGGWTGTERTLVAMEATGFEVQTDIVLATHIVEEWEGRLLYWLLMELWGELTTTAQPYYAAEDDLMVPAADPADAVPVLQLPANAITADYLTLDELGDIFHENWPGGRPLEAPTVYHTGFHPTGFPPSVFDKLDLFLGNHVDGIYDEEGNALYTDDAGPVIYAATTELVAAFPLE